MAFYNTIVFGQDCVEEGNKKCKQRFADREKALPESFDRKEYPMLAQILSIPTTSADRYTKKWLEEGKLEKMEHGKYRSIKEKH